MHVRDQAGERLRGTLPQQQRFPFVLSNRKHSEIFWMFGTSRRRNRSEFLPKMPGELGKALCMPL